jgi:BirA family transcriptional regulator, biotin operon repressor / biotin---[acetyl-CoA-carboxylase] ligase
MTVRPPGGYHLTRLDAVGSTNDVAKSAAMAQAVDGTVFWTPHQTAGRGTHGREWSTPPGNLAVSIVKRPRMPMRFASQAALVTAVSLAEALTDLGLRPGRVRLKWPNDVMVDGSKISGILLEGFADGPSVSWLVVGVGVNVLHHPAETRHPATNLALAGLDTDAETVLRHFLHAFDRWWNRWRHYDFQVVATAWAARTLHKPGDMLQITQADHTLTGRYKGLAHDGALVVEGPDGLERQIASGEIFARAVATQNETD